MLKLEAGVNFDQEIRKRVELQQKQEILNLHDTVKEKDATIARKTEEISSKEVTIRQLEDINSKITLQHTQILAKQSKKMEQQRVMISELLKKAESYQAIERDPCKNCKRQEVEIKDKTSLITRMEEKAVIQNCLLDKLTKNLKTKQVDSVIIDEDLRNSRKKIFKLKEHVERLISEKRKIREKFDRINSDYHSLKISGYLKLLGKIL